MNTTQPSTDSQFEAFRAGIVPGKFVRIEYMTDLSEFIKTDALVKKVNPDTVELGTGETVPIDRIVRIAGAISPKFPGYESYSCDC
ncbi:hypothetical protein [Rudanella lutea]|uniref:hypothetical protein n=1 Tax=Rudanella lutea TaxID=451374 RepID=UPI00037E1D75|nr:hypothetical protein [Rudanella lutea]